MNSLILRFRALTSPHALAERLLDEDEALSEEARAWLAAHLETCPRCRAVQAQRVQLAALLGDGLPELRAPEGFAARVRIAAARGDTPAAEVKRSPMLEPSIGVRWATGAVAAAGLALAVVGGWGLIPGAQPDGVQVGGTGHLQEAKEHFVVRAPGQGAARVRAGVTQVLTDIGASVSPVERGLRCTLPRETLVEALTLLEGLGGLEVDLRREPTAEEVEVTLLFVLD